MMEERLRVAEQDIVRIEEKHLALANMVKSIKDEQTAFFKETRELRAKRNGNHWKEKGSIALGGGGLGVGALAALQAIIERLAG